MNKNRLLTTIALFAAYMISAAGTAAVETSEWLLRIRSSGNYAYESNGMINTSPDPDGQAFVWTIEAAGGEMFKLRNKASGHWICLDKDGRIVTGDNPETWKVTGFPYSMMRSVGWYRISAADGAEGKWLKEENGRLCYGEADEKLDRNHHWTFVRMDGESIPFALEGNSVHESSFMGWRHAEALSDTEIRSDYHGDRTWTLSKDISSFPKFTMKGNNLLPALYNMALEETLLDIRSDSTFRAGALWPDTWTRDAVYSIWFAYAWIMPEVSRLTLEKQTLKNPSEALQDTGTGGSYPISTDRVVWALAAWEYYLTTGDKDWLATTYEGLKNTALKDLHVAYDPEIGLFKGETCSMDWRTHTYPNWFTNAHIGESFSSGTNALHLFLYRFLDTAAGIIKAPEDEQELWRNTAESLKTSFNKNFWDSDKNMYSCWLYPAFLDYAPSDRVGVMSNGLAAVCGVASEEQTAAIVENFPLYPYGAAVLYPSKPDGFAYHNKGVWPVWQNPLLYAAKGAGNMAVVNHLMQTLVRSSALFLTHKENWTYDTGYDRNTALNSDRQLWSVASYIGMVYRLLFGIEMHREGVTFKPFIPEYFGGELHLEGLKYRRAVIDMTVTGYGDEIASIKVNGRRKSSDWILPAGARGKYNIEIAMKSSGRVSQANIVGAGPGYCWSPYEPTASLENETLTWTEDACCVSMLEGNGSAKRILPPYDMHKEENGFYSVYMEAENGMTSDLSNPVFKTSWTVRYEAEDFADEESVSTEYAGYSGKGYVVDAGASHKDLEFRINVPADGDYIIRFTGANGHGPHDVYCTVRSLFWDGEDKSTVFLEAYGKWNVWTSSNHVIVRNVKAGEHTVTIRFNPEDRGFDNNMSYNRANLNDWNIDYMTVSAL